MHQPIHLGVNIDHVATLRQARGTTYPSVIEAARVAENAGADGITIHLREDRRHIQDADVFALKDSLKTRMNLEMALTDEMLMIAQDVRPHFVCFVPEKREELTTEGGLDVAGQIETVRPCVAQLQDREIDVSLFIDPDSAQIDAAVQVGAKLVEIHTGAYADALTPAIEDAEFARIESAVKYAHSKGLIVNAGHGLHLQNTQRIAAIKEIYELNIGHSVVSQALFDGLGPTVANFKKLMNEARGL